MTKAKTAFDRPGILATVVRKAKYLLITPIKIAYLEKINRSSDRSLLDPNGPVLSLTSYGERLGRVHLAIESVAAGSRLPSRWLLYLDKPINMADFPELVRLQRRGLEIISCAPLGPHCKYYPYISGPDFNESKPLVTMDDDILYPQYWMESLLRSYHTRPQGIHGHRVHVVSLDGDRISPYSHWSPCLDKRPSAMNFATGVSGVIYPPEFLKFLKVAGDDFLGCAPRQDDIWLHVQSLRGNFLVSQVDAIPRHFSPVPRTQSSGLMRNNVSGGGNDACILRIYSPRDIAHMKQTASMDSGK